MSRLWIAVDARIRDNGKVWEFASALLLEEKSTGSSTGRAADAPRTYPYDLQRKALSEAIGYLVQLWGEVAENRPDGDMSRVPDPLLEQWAGWPGEPGRFAYFFKSIFVNDALINDWEEHNGKLLAMRERERRRGERRRGAKPSAGSSGGSSTGSSSGPSTGSSAANQNQNLNHSTTSSASGGPSGGRPAKAKRATSWVAEAVDSWKAIGFVSHGEAGRILQPVVDEKGWPEVKASLGAYIRLRPHRKANGDYDAAVYNVAYCTLRDFVTTYTYWFNQTQPMNPSVPA